MKTMNKLFAAILALVMILALSAPVMAVDEENPENPTNEETTYEITIIPSTSNQNAESANGHIYEAYEILKGTVDPDSAAAGSANIKLAVTGWGANIDHATLLSKLQADSTFEISDTNVFATVDGPARFAEVISNNNFNTTHEEKLAHILNECLTGAPVATSYVAANGENQVSPYTLSVPAGYYLIKDKDDSLNPPAGEETEEEWLNKDYTDIILRVSGKVTVNHKGSVPTVDKKVSEHNHTYKDAIDAATATAVYFKLEGTLPSDYEKYESYAYTFVDVMSEGIDLDFAEPAEGQSIDPKTCIQSVYALYKNGTEVPLTHYTVSYDEATNKLSVAFANLKHDQDTHNFDSSTRIVVVYRAKLNEKAVIATEGNENKVYLQYSNNPNGTGIGTTSSDNAKVYTFGVQILKYDGENADKKLEGVTFKLFRKAGASNEEKEYAVFTGNVITDWVSEDALTGSENLVLATDAQGLLSMHGLDSGVKYYLEEIETNDGYNLIKEPIEFQMTPIANDIGPSTGLDVTPSTYYQSSANSYMVAGADGQPDVLGVQLQIANSQGAQLPTTGGIGTTLFYVLGSVLAVGAVILLITKKRMAN